MTDRFVDTSGWAAWGCLDEPHHIHAAVAFQEVWDCGHRLVTTTYILAELTALFIRLRVPREQQIELLGEIRSDPSVVVEAIEPTWLDSTWKLWASRPDKEWTVVDCDSFVVMRSRSLTEAITADHHFEQAGFIRLLK